MSSPHKSSRNSNNGVNIQSEKKPSLPVRVMKGTAFQIVSFILAVFLLTVGYAAVTWTTIPSGSGASGQPVNQTLVQGIINNINYLSGVLVGVDTRLDTLESGATTGGTVTGPLRWSSEYSGQAHTTAWNTCLTLAPAGAWRLPTADEIEYGRHSNSGLFNSGTLTEVRYYWSSSPGYNFSVRDFLAWVPDSSDWDSCDMWYASVCYHEGGGPASDPMVFRCVSDA